MQTLAEMSAANASNLRCPPLAGYKNDLARELVNDPSQLNTDRVMEIQKEYLHSSHELAPSPSFYEQVRKRTVTVLESSTALNTIASVFFVALTFPVAAA